MDKELYREYLKTSALGLEVGLSVIVGAGLGYLLEQYFDITPWGLVIGFLLGGITAARTLYRFAKKYVRDNPSPLKGEGDE